MVNKLQNRVLIEFPKDGNADTREKVGNWLLKPLRVFCGKKFEANTPPTVKNTHYLATRLFAALFVLITLPITLVGLLVCWSSKTHGLKYNRAKEAMERPEVASVTHPQSDPTQTVTAPAAPISATPAALLQPIPPQVLAPVIAIQPASQEAAATHSEETEQEQHWTIVLTPPEQGPITSSTPCPTSTVKENQALTLKQQIEECGPEITEQQKNKLAKAIAELDPEAIVDHIETICSRTRYFNFGIDKWPLERFIAISAAIAKRINSGDNELFRVWENFIRLALNPSLMPDSSDEHNPTVNIDRNAFLRAVNIQLNSINEIVLAENVQSIITLLQIRGVGDGELIYMLALFIVRKINRSNASSLWLEWRSLVQRLPTECVARYFKAVRAQVNGDPDKMEGLRRNMNVFFLRPDRHLYLKSFVSEADSKEIAQLASQHPETAIDLTDAILADVVEKETHAKTYFTQSNIERIVSLVTVFDKNVWPWVQDNQDRLVNAYPALLYSACNELRAIASQAQNDAAARIASVIVPVVKLLRNYCPGNFSEGFFKSVTMAFSTPQQKRALDEGVAQARKQLHSAELPIQQSVIQNASLSSLQSALEDKKTGSAGLGDR